MNTDLIFVFDVDGVTNASGDDNFNRTDMKHILLREESRPVSYLTFSPQAATDLTELSQKHEVIWGTCWNARTKLLLQAGFPLLRFLEIQVENEEKSKTDHIARLAQNRKVVWVDDFALEWLPMIDKSLHRNITAIQPDHRQGISVEEMAFIKSL